MHNLVRYCDFRAFFIGRLGWESLESTNGGGMLTMLNMHQQLEYAYDAEQVPSAASR